MVTGKPTKWVDAHVHIWTDDRIRYPRIPGAPEYSPARFTADDFLAHASPAGVTRAVLVQVSSYGTDNSYLLDTVAVFQGISSGIAIIAEDLQNPGTVMSDLAAKGIRGFRLNGRSSAASWLHSPAIRAMWHCGAERNLAICTLINPEALPIIDQMCASFPDTPVVIDHMARIGADGVIRDDDVNLLCGLAEHLHTFVKISGFYALGRKQPPYSDLLPMIRRLFYAYGPSRLMWGTDSPFQVTNEYGYQRSLELITDHFDSLSVDDRVWLLAKTAESIFF